MAKGTALCVDIEPSFPILKGVGPNVRISPKEKELPELHGTVSCDVWEPGAEHGEHGGTKNPALALQSGEGHIGPGAQQRL